MKFVYVTCMIVLTYINLYSMEYPYYQRDLFFLSGSEQYYPTEQKTKLKSNKKINIHNNKPTFWQCFLHMAASITSCGKYIMVPINSPVVEQSNHHTDYTQDIVCFDNNTN